MTVIAGIDLATLEIDNEDLVFPDPVPGRILNADGDIIAYNCAGNDDTTREEVLFNLDAEIKNLMKVAGATSYVLHITGTGSDKGLRHDMATVRQYQANRAGKPKPRNLEWVRKQMLVNWHSVAHMDQEADDGLAQTQHEYINNGKRDLCVLWSADKDLRMVPGLHVCPDKGNIVDVFGYGTSWYDEQRGKVLGWGTSFFWHQMLMGDTADNIPGLESFSQKDSLEHWPTAPVLEALRRMKEGTMPSGKLLTDAQERAATAKYAQLRAEFKQKPCGARSVYEYLKDCTNDTEAYNKVSLAYAHRYGDKHTYISWRGTELTRSWLQMLYEQAILLWMRRVPDATDCVRFLREVRDDQ